MPTCPASSCSKAARPSRRTVAWGCTATPSCPASTRPRSSRPTPPRRSPTSARAAPVSPSGGGSTSWPASTAIFCQRPTATPRSKRRFTIPKPPSACRRRCRRSATSQARPRPRNRHMASTRSRPARPTTAVSAYWHDDWWSRACGSSNSPAWATPAGDLPTRGTSTAGFTRATPRWRSRSISQSQR